MGAVYPADLSSTVHTAEILRFCKPRTTRTRKSILLTTSMDYLQRRAYERSYLPFSWPEVYHNSFWSNYYTNYWQPSSVYYNSFSLPSSYTLPPSYTNLSCSTPLPPYEDEEPLDLYNYQEPSQTYKSIKSLSHGYYSKMVSKRYPFVNGHVAMFT